MIKVLLADDFAIVRTVLRQVLEKAEDMQVVAMASNGQEAVNEAVSHCPDVVVMDISMPTMDGVEATRQICAKCPESRVLMVSSYYTPQHIRRSMESGASGYVLKDNISRDLVTAVRILHQGGRYFSKQIAEVAKLYINGNNKTADPTETERASDRLKKLKSDLPFLFFSYAMYVEFFV